MECPKCKTEMTKKYVESVQIDKCPSCGGVWLDRGELDSIRESAEESSSGGGFSSGFCLGLCL